MPRMESGCTKKLIRSKSGLRIVSSDDNFRSPFILGEPEWIPDREITNCSECKSKFDFIRRKHHCRRCGRIYCGACCDTKIGLPRMCFVDPVRVCGRCAVQTYKEKDFFDHQLKTLINGATFVIDLPPVESESSNILLCKLSPDHRHLVFEGGISENLSPVELTRIKFVGVGKDQKTAEQITDIEGIYLYDILKNVLIFTVAVKENNYFKR
ncbi:zinc finger FYVE domain-containing protein 21 isoform X2 [Anabrus simplex]|uniref:zinc finger FYVE domain-containing protein 21 isoform X2 n=1 Tax=Anabrus simplex TaxID=316456 RepID=UPI0035A35526